MPRLLLALALVVLVPACSADAPQAAPLGGRATTAPAPVGDLTAAQLSDLLLQPEDLPGLSQRRPFASAALSTQATPQLSLCRPTVPDAPHAIANVLASSGTPGAAQVFQVLSAYADPAGAQAAFARAVDAARGCPAYEVDSTPYRVEDLAEVAVPGSDGAAHYRLTTPEVVGGDVRTLARAGRFLVLVTGFGAPPEGQTLLEFQAGVAARAVARLP